MKKYSVQTQKVIDGYIEFYGDDEDEYLDLLDYARAALDEDESIFVAEDITWEVGYFDVPIEIDENENSELWK